jgi:1-acyl-sn-glycerol-3-phosphate acyltransferase
MGAIRLLIRLPFLLLHIVLGTPATVLSFYPPFRRKRVGGQPLHDVMLRWWAGTACRIFGVSVRSEGYFPPGPQLVVANHISWLDIQVLHSLSPMGFVAKSEIGDWPVLGFLASVGGSVFHRRGSHDSASGVAAAMADRLASGGKVAIFPEGGILPGFGVKRFHARLFAAAIETGSEVQPVAVRYLRGGRQFADMTFRKGEGFAGNILRLLSQPRRIAEALILEPLPSGGAPRRQLALAAEDAVRAAFDSEIPGEHA